VPLSRSALRRGPFLRPCGPANGCTRAKWQQCRGRNPARVRWTPRLGRMVSTLAVSASRLKHVRTKPVAWRLGSGVTDSLKAAPSHCAASPINGQKVKIPVAQSAAPHSPRVAHPASGGRRPAQLHPGRYRMANRQSRRRRHDPEANVLDEGAMPPCAECRPSHVRMRYALTPDGGLECILRCPVPFRKFRYAVMATFQAAIETLGPASITLPSLSSTASVAVRRSPL
jgi:hypothetical protein